MPARYLPSRLPLWADPVVHIGLFTVGTWILSRTKGLRWGLAVGSGAAVASELAQEMLPIVRSGSIRDVLVDGIGIAIGAGLFTLLACAHERPTESKPRRQVS